MEDLKRPEVLDVEPFFNGFVVNQGGQLISSMFPTAIITDNADYFFDNPTVISELKCFQKDLFSEEEDIPRYVNLLEKWAEKKLIKHEDILKIIWGRKKIPESCIKDMILAAERTIDRAIHKANKQIRETKNLLEKPDALGLLLLCNDGNYFLNHKGFLALISDLMARKYINSHIDGFVYFTVNQASIIPDSDLDQHLWYPQYKPTDNNILLDFVNDLGSKFNDYYVKVAGIPPMTNNKIDTPEKAEELLSKMIFIPKNIIYKKNSQGDL